MNRLTYLILGGLLVAIIVIAFVGANLRKQEADLITAGKPSSNVIGKKDSPVTFTEFVDFQCEACYAYYPIMQQIEEQYKDQVRFEIRYFVRKNNTSHRASWAAAQSAEAAARQGKFWAMQNKLFTNQKTWDQSPDPQALFDDYARAIGLDMSEFDKDRISKAVEETLQKDYEDITKLGGNGTPAFTLNGKLLDESERPSPNVASFQRLLDQALSQTATSPKSGSN